jgi:hypothetical protein
MTWKASETGELGGRVRFQQAVAVGGSIRIWNEGKPTMGTILLGSIMGATLAGIRIFISSGGRSKVITELRASPSSPI